MVWGEVVKTAVPDGVGWLGLPPEDEGRSPISVNTEGTLVSTTSPKETMLYLFHYTSYIFRGKWDKCLGLEPSSTGIAEWLQLFKLTLHKHVTPIVERPRHNGDTSIV